MLLVDIDGVLNVYGVEECPPGYAEFDLFPGDDEPVRLAVVHGEWLRELAVVFDLAWASAWGAEGHEHLGPILGLEPFPFAHMPPVPFEPRDKVPAVASFVGERACAWLDDIVTPEAVAWAAAREHDTLLVEVDPSRGLERHHVDRLLAWGRSLDRP